MIPFEAIRGMDGAREADVVIGDKTLHVAAVHGTGNLRKFIERMRAENIHYDFHRSYGLPRRLYRWWWSTTR